MSSVKLVYRDADRLPVIIAIRKMARLHYELAVDLVKIQDEEAFEASLFDGSADVLIEHLEFLYERAAQGKKITMFCAPGKGGGLHLVVRRPVQNVEEFRGQTMAVRAQGQPFAVTLWLRTLGLDKNVKTIVIDDKEIGRWGHWKKVISGECVATFMSPLYLPQDLNAGLKALAVPEIPIVGHFAQACLAALPQQHPSLMHAYVKAVLHALAWLIKHPDDAFTALAPEMKAKMKLDDEELRQRFDSVVSGIKLKPYPPPQSVANTYEIATLEYAGTKGVIPLSLWDLHWVNKELDDQGFIDALS